MRATVAPIGGREGLVEIAACTPRNARNLRAAGWGGGGRREPLPSAPSEAERSAGLQ